MLQNLIYYFVTFLYRIKKNAMILSSKLQSEQIPFYAKDLPDDIYKGMVYQDIKAYYRLSNGFYSVADLQRIINRPKRYIKAKSVLMCKKLEIESLFLSVTKDIHSDT